MYDGEIGKFDRALSRIARAQSMARSQDDLLASGARRGHSGRSHIAQITGAQITGAQITGAQINGIATRAATADAGHALADAGTRPGTRPGTRQARAKVSVGINDAIAAEHFSYQKIAGRWRIASKGHRET
jgi:hypothetical protein